MTTNIELLRRVQDLVVDIRRSDATINPSVRTLLYRLTTIVHDVIQISKVEEKTASEPAREGLHFNSSEYLKTSFNQKIEVTYAANGRIHSIRVVE